MKGKNRCKILKDIRKKIAEENNIEYITTECKYKGDCLGTCPKCESEVRYLESELEKRRLLGYKVTVAGLAVGLTVATTGCDFLAVETLDGDLAITSSESAEESSKGESSNVSSEESVEVLMGDISVPGDESSVTGEVPLMGVPEVVIPSIPNPYEDMMGDYAVFYATLDDVAELSETEIYDELSVWNRAYIDFGWKDNICNYSQCCTSFATDNGQVITIQYDEAGNVVSVGKN